MVEVASTREAIQIAVQDSTTFIRIQTWESPMSGAQQKLAQASGAPWPTQTGAAAGAVFSGRADILCLGPADWLCVAADPGAAALLQVIDAACIASPFRATDVSHALARIQIAGPKARELLSKGCSLDLHPLHFAPAHCTRTRFAGMSVVVRCMLENTFECIVASTYREYFSAWLDDAALEFSANSR